MDKREAAVQDAVDDLFTSGCGNKAKRLVMMVDDYLNGPGWSRPIIAGKLRAVFDAGYNARGEAGWNPVRTVEDLPPVVNEQYWVTDRRGFVYSDRYNGDTLFWLRFIAAWMPYQQPPAYTEDRD